MEINCPNCTYPTQVSIPQHQTLAASLLVCPNCQTQFRADGSVPYKKDFRQKLPKAFQEEQQEDTKVIHLPYNPLKLVGEEGLIKLLNFRTRRGYVALALIGMMLIRRYTDPIGSEEGMWFLEYYSFFFYGGLALLIYFSLPALKKIIGKSGFRARVEISPQTLRYYPGVNSGADVDLAAEEVEQLYVVRHLMELGNKAEILGRKLLIGEEDKEIDVFTVMVKSKNQPEAIPLVEGLPMADFAHYIEQEIEILLKIPNRPVQEEHRPVKL